MQDNDSYNKPLHYFAIVVAIAVVLLITSGSIVTTIGAGLAVPDWPLSFGSVNPDGRTPRYAPSTDIASSAPRLGF